MPRPPNPGGFVRPNVTIIEEALRDVTFPISKRELMDRISDGRTVVLNGRNVDLRTLVRDLNDDFFESDQEFREVLEIAYADIDRLEADDLPMPPTGFPETMRRGAPGRSDQPSIPEDNA